MPQTVKQLRRIAKRKLKYWGMRTEETEMKPSHKYAVLVGYLQALEDVKRCKT